MKTKYAAGLTLLLTLLILSGSYFSSSLFDSVFSLNRETVKKSTDILPQEGLIYVQKDPGVKFLPWDEYAPEKILADGINWHHHAEAIFDETVPRFLTQILDGLMTLSLPNNSFNAYESLTEMAQFHHVNSRTAFFLRVNQEVNGSPAVSSGNFTADSADFQKYLSSYAITSQGYLTSFHCVSAEQQNKELSREEKKAAQEYLVKTLSEFPDVMRTFQDKQFSLYSLFDKPMSPEEFEKIKTVFFKEISETDNPLVRYWLGLYFLSWEQAPLYYAVSENTILEPNDLETLSKSQIVATDYEIMLIFPNIILYFDPLSLTFSGFDIPQAVLMKITEYAGIEF